MEQLVRDARRDGTLDPADWRAFRAQGHRMLDHILPYVEHIRARPVWQPAPGEVRVRFRDKLPLAPTDLADVHAEFMRSILPFATGNSHPGFMGTFASPADYRQRATRRLAAGSPWPCGLGPDLSRGFRALKTWFTLTVFGCEALGAAISRTTASRVISRV